MRADGFCLRTARVVRHTDAGATNSAFSTNSCKISVKKTILFSYKRFCFYKIDVLNHACSR